jgi:hypothetical protein
LKCRPMGILLGSRLVNRGARSGLFAVELLNLTRRIRQFLGSHLICHLPVVP